MSIVIAKPNEKFENLLRRFRKSVDNSGIMLELRKREHFEKPSVKRKRKAAAARKRTLRQEKQEQNFSNIPE